LRTREADVLSYILGRKNGETTITGSALSNGGKILDKLTFYRGLLCALRTQREDFVAEGDCFHRAFAAAVEHAQEKADPASFLMPPQIHLDPMFGVYHEADEMLLEGEQDLLISLLNPRHRRASFRITKSEAEAELREISGAAEWFKDLGRIFHEQLG